MILSHKELVDIALESLEAERSGDVQLGLELLVDDWRKTSMIVSGNKLFPLLEGPSIEPAMRAAYVVKGREFHVFNVAANEETQTVFLELAEVEPREGGPVTWPYVMVLEIENGKIRRTRHYGDPALLDHNLKIEDIKRAIQT